MGFRSTRAINSESSRYGVDNASERTFVLCPGTYTLSDRKHALSLRSGQTVQCGDDGSGIDDETGRGRCILSGSWSTTAQATVAAGATNIKVKGITFAGTSHRSVSTGSNNGGGNTIDFVDCHWEFGAGSSGMLSGGARSHLYITMAASFEGCTFTGNKPTENVVFVKYPGSAAFTGSLFTA